MKAAPFQYHAPTSIDEALGLLAEHGDDAKLLAGGQSLVPILAMRLTRVDHLIDLNRIADLQYIEPNNGAIAIGAMTRQAVAEHSDDVKRLAPLMARAIPHIGHFQIRNRGTIGGSISHADPASELPAVVCTLGADIEVRGHRGHRRIPASEYFTSTWETAVDPDEMLVGIEIPNWGDRSGFAIEEFALRRGDFAIVGVACGVRLDGSGAVDRAALTFFGMGATPIFATSISEDLVGKSSGDIDIEEAVKHTIAHTSPVDDVHASRTYRERVGSLLATRALGTALEEAAHG